MKAFAELLQDVGFALRCPWPGSKRDLLQRLQTVQINLSGVGN